MNDRIREVSLNTLEHSTGLLTVVEEGIDVPFHFRRAYFLHHLDPSGVRGSHAHKNLSQLMIAVAGNFTVELEREGKRSLYSLASPTTGLLIPPMTWRTLKNFSTDSVCLVLASDNFDEADYIRDYSEFLKLDSGPRGLLQSYREN